MQRRRRCCGCPGWRHSFRGTFRYVRLAIHSLITARIFCLTSLQVYGALFCFRWNRQPGVYIPTTRLVLCGKLGTLYRSKSLLWISFWCPLQKLDRWRIPLPQRLWRDKQDRTFRFWWARSSVKFWSICCKLFFQEFTLPRLAAKFLSPHLWNAVSRIISV